MNPNKAAIYNPVAVKKTYKKSMVQIPKIYKKSEIML
jgi:hypothetical protein